MKLDRYTFLQIGLGSMGKRRIRNLLACGVSVSKIMGLDVSIERGQEAKKRYKIKVFSSPEKIFKNYNPDVYIISTPPNKHMEYALRAARAQKSFFMEVGNSDKGYKGLLPLLDSSFVGAPSCTFRYHPAVAKIKKIVESGKIGRLLCFTYHLGQYLPDWHPWEDYRKVYFGQKKTGGCREMFPYELRWINYILNSEVKSVGGIAKKISDLDMTADDTFTAVLEYRSGVIGNFLIDLLSRSPKRTLRLIGSGGILDWEWQDNTIKIFSSKDKKTKILSLKEGKKEAGYITTEDMYILEMRDFLRALKGNFKFPYSFEEDWKVLKVLRALEKSNKERRFIPIKQ